MALRPSSRWTAAGSEFGHDITMLKMAIFDQVVFIEIEPAVIQGKSAIKHGKQVS